MNADKTIEDIFVWTDTSGFGAAGEIGFFKERWVRRTGDGC
jgi:hypothetical protein